jgi:hypothetical protein
VYNFFEDSTELRRVQCGAVIEGCARWLEYPPPSAVSYCAAFLAGENIDELPQS